MRRPQRGLAVVEMAIVAPLFLMLMLGVGELGRACYHYNTLTKAVRDGVRYLSANALNAAGLYDPQAADITIAQNLIVYGTPTAGSTPLLPGLSTGDVAVASVTAAGGTHVVVTVTYGYVPLLAVIPTFGQGTVNGAVGTMTASLAMVAM